MRHKPLRPRLYQLSFTLTKYGVKWEAIDYDTLKCIVDGVEVVLKSNTGCESFEIPELNQYVRTKIDNFYPTYKGIESQVKCFIEHAKRNGWKGMIE